jgi:hypothetical protein
MVFHHALTPERRIVTSAWMFPEKTTGSNSRGALMGADFPCNPRQRGKCRSEKLRISLQTASMGRIDAI